MNDKIIEKIKKLFALANNEGATLNEAENAMRMARKLLDKHNLSMGDLADLKEEVSVEFRNAQDVPWMRSLIHAISTLYNCKYFVSRNFGSEPKHIIIGTESNRITSGLIINRLEYLIKKEGKGKGAAFRNGAAVGVWTTVQAIQKERREEEAVVGTGLMLIDVDKKQMGAADDFLKGMGLNLTKSKSKTKMSSDGYQYGKGLSVNPQMGGKRKALN